MPARSRSRLAALSALSILAIESLARAAPPAPTPTPEGPPVETESLTPKAAGRARNASPEDSDTADAKPEPTLSAAEERRLLKAPGPDLHLFGTIAFGGGLRFNNPYRLHTQLGSTAKSVSLTAPYTDFGGAFTYGSANSLQHGVNLHAGFSMSGPQQTYLSLSYLAAYRASHSFMVYGRIGPNILLSPDANVGGELAGSFSYFITGALGLTSELAFDVFYGAATLDKTYTIYPILSGQLGIIVDYEVLP